jgi:ABC-type multidrug transport system fused ATPase/permease subunit
VYNLGATYRRRVTRQYLRLPLAWHHRHPSGQLLSNANSDVESMWNVFQPLPMAFGVVVMLGLRRAPDDPRRPVPRPIGLTVFPMLLVANLLFQRRHVAEGHPRSSRCGPRSPRSAHESFEAALVVKSLGREDQEAERFTAVTHGAARRNISVGRSRGVFDPAIEAIPTIGTCGHRRRGLADRDRPHHRRRGRPDRLLFSILAFPVRALGWVLAEMPRSVVGWDRVHGVLDAKGSMTYGTGIRPRAGRGQVQRQNVSYAYEVDVGARRYRAQPRV